MKGRLEENFKTSYGRLQHPLNLCLDKKGELNGYRKEIGILGFIISWLIGGDVVI